MGRRFWDASPILLAPNQLGAGRGSSLKDPSVVFHDRRWHLFVTVRGGPSTHRIVYFSFDTFEDARRAHPVELPFETDMVCAPQVFFFRPHSRWYLVAQGRSRKARQYGPVYSTNDRIDDPASWSALRPVVIGAGESSVDAEVDGAAFLAARDFWTIREADRMHLFFTTGDGRMWQSWTSVASFPQGWTRPVVALRGNVFEASHIYTVANGFVCIIEARRRGLRLQQRFDAAHLHGPWLETARPFAAHEQIDGSHRNWFRHVSHGELIRANNDERMQVGPAPARWLFQGLKRRQGWPRPYRDWPWSLGLLTARWSWPSDLSSGSRNTR